MSCNSESLPPAPVRYKDKRRQQIFAAAFRMDKEYCLRGGGAIQNAWSAGYMGQPIGRHQGHDRTSLSYIVYRGGQARRKWELSGKQERKTTK